MAGAHLKDYLLEHSQASKLGIQSVTSIISKEQHEGISAIHLAITENM